MPRFILLKLLSCLVLCLALAGTANAGIADSLAYQGRLTDPTDNPVPDGPRDLILSIWSDSVGGTMLHSEIVTVTTTNGLFTTCIGCASSAFFDVFGDFSTLYLQLQLSGQAAMMPRTLFRNVPFALSASSVHGEATAGLSTSQSVMNSKPTTSSVAIKTKGTGADANRVISTTTSDSAMHEVSTGADGSLFSKAKGIIVVKGGGGGGGSR